jgi:cobalt/nickel transport protein
MENGPVMDMGTPVNFLVVINGRKINLNDQLKHKKENGKSLYTAGYSLNEPGDHVFGFVPAPYWEPSEQKIIIHYTKVVVNAYGAEEGWDEPLLFPVEIDPLVRPYGLWTGNTFRGVVKKEGRPVPFAIVEVEYLNNENLVEIPADPFVTQVLMSDINGVFTYTMPRSGWWGFAALVEGDELVKSPEGNRVEVELGGLLWVKCIDMKSKK